MAAEASSSSSEESMAMAASSSEAPVAASSSEAMVASSAEPVPAAAENKLPATGLSPNTILAAAGSEDVTYVGVWAKDAAGCAQIDQPGEADFLVITRSTLRVAAGTCYGNFPAAVDGKATFIAGCPSAGGNASFSIVQSGPDTLQINGGAQLVRCKP